MQYVCRYSPLRTQCKDVRIFTLKEPHENNTMERLTPLTRTLSSADKFSKHILLHLTSVLSLKMYATLHKIALNVKINTT